MARRIALVVDSEIYPLPAVINTCYAFLDQCYIYLKNKGKGGGVLVNLKPKRRLSLNSKRLLADRFRNELLHATLRLQISKNNKKIREYIVGTALGSSLPVCDLFTFGKNQPKGEAVDYLDDPLRIALPWEEKHGKKKNKKN